MATIDEVDTMRDDRDVDGLIRALDDEDPSASAREAAATAYKWVVGRLQEIEATREPKTPPTR